MVANLIGAARFPFDVAIAKRHLHFIWQEWFVLLLPWRQRVALWNWLFHADGKDRLDWRISSSPFLREWLREYWPFGARLLPKSLHWTIWRYCFPEAISTP